MAVKKKSDIIFHIELDETNVPEKITWQATDSGSASPQECKSIILSIWDHLQKDTLRIDLWTKDMRIDEMDNHFIQTLITLSESYQKATHHDFVAEDMRKFCKSLIDKINEKNKNAASSR